MAVAVITQREIEGLWRRAYISTPASGPANEDRDTRVYWFQAAGLYADIRVPEAFAAGLAGAALADLDAATLRALGACEGFAGRASLQESVCTWQRIINLQGPQSGIDHGRLVPAPQGILEYGIDADFVELWVPDGDRTGAIEGRVFEDGQGRLAFLIQAQDRALLACDRPERMRTAAGFTARLEGLLSTSARDSEALADLFDAEYSIASMQGGVAVVEVSTLPTRVGQCLFESLPEEGRPFVTLHQAFDGRSVSRLWTPIPPALLHDLLEEPRPTAS